MDSPRNGRWSAAARGRAGWRTRAGYRPRAAPKDQRWHDAGSADGRRRIHLGLTGFQHGADNIFKTVEGGQELLRCRHIHSLHAYVRDIPPPFRALGGTGGQDRRDERGPANESRRHCSLLIGATYNAGGYSGNGVVSDSITVSWPPIGRSICPVVSGCKQPAQQPD